jgi:WD40 repeat protein
VSGDRDADHHVTVPSSLTASPFSCLRLSRAALKVWDEESGQLHRELEGSGEFRVTALVSYLSPDGQEVRLVVGLEGGDLRVYDPEAGSVLHRLEGHRGRLTDVACIASSSAAPHHPRLVSTSAEDHAAKVWDGETGGLLADLLGHTGEVVSAAVWKEHTGGHDRIATGDHRTVKVWDGEALALLRELDYGSGILQMVPFRTAEGSYSLLLGGDHRRGLEVWNPELGRRVQEGIHLGCPFAKSSFFESAEGRYLLAIVGWGFHRFRDYDEDPREVRTFLDVYDLGEAPARPDGVRGAHKTG